MECSNSRHHLEMGQAAPWYTSDQSLKSVRKAEPTVKGGLCDYSQLVYIYECCMMTWHAADGGLEDKRFKDPGCFRHMTGKTSWFSSLTLTQRLKYITFGKNQRSGVKGPAISICTIRLVGRDTASRKSHSAAAHHRVFCCLRSIVPQEIFDRFSSGFRLCFISCFNSVSIEIPLGCWITFCCGLLCPVS
ncbi:hypothetical protein GUJ93_ZPchr0011g27278 [Zizania palustris]|uniref:Uncharacterized protein n=1 Tax=Zizania palustris TaxID=103762 RepID=A0A8J6BKR5_ZIZPA|nr:hypothetical protein GUJ93_ZPchr0011g27278 [Zizania palustris]